MDECGEQRERGLTDRLTTSFILGLFWVYILYMSVCEVSAKQMWGSEGKPDTLVCTHYSSCVSKIVSAWRLYVEDKPAQVVYEKVC